MDSPCILGSSKDSLCGQRETKSETLLVFAGKYPLLKELRSRGFSIVNFQKPEFCDRRSLPLCDSTVLGDLDDAETFADLAGELVRTRRVIGAYSQNEYGLHAAALTNEMLGANCRFNSTYAVLNGRDKRRFRERVSCARSERDISWRFCQDAEDLSRFLTEVSWPEGVVIKPAMGVGSIGVRRVNAASEIGPASVPIGGVLAETFISGTQYSVETFSYCGVHQVICVNREINTCGCLHDWFINIGHMLPVFLDGDTDRAIRRRVFDALDAIGVFHGPAHTEVVLRDGRVSIIEINTRPAGSPIPAMIQWATGLDLYSHSLDWFLGRNVRVETQCLPGRGAAVRHFEPAPGRLVAIRGVEKARSMKGVREIVLKVRPGETIRPLMSAFDRIGYVMAVAETAEDAYAICCEAVDMIQFEVEPAR